MKIDLDIDPTIPESVRNIIVRAADTLKRDGDERRIALNIHMASMWIQQAYFYGCIDGGNRVSKNWNESIKNLGKAVQS